MSSNTPNTVSNICGTWVVESSENFDEFLKELGLKFLNTYFNIY